MGVLVLASIHISIKFSVFSIHYQKWNDDNAHEIAAFDKFISLPPWMWMSQVEETKWVLCIIDEPISSMRGNNNASYIQLDKFIVCTDFVTDTTVGGIHLDLSTGIIPHVNQILVASVLSCFQYIISSPSIFSYNLSRVKGLPG